jgi:hypothetical protein
MDLFSNQDILERYLLEHTLPEDPDTLSIREFNTTGGSTKTIVSRTCFIQSEIE